MSDETPQTPEALVRALFTDWNAGHSTPEVYERAMAPGFVCHGPPGVNHTHEPGDENCIFHIFRNCFEALRFDVHRYTADEHRVVAEFTVRGRQVAAFRNIQPPAEESIFTGLTIFRIADGKIAEGWGSFNWG